MAFDSASKRFLSSKSLFLEHKALGFLLAVKRRRGYRNEDAQKAAQLLINNTIHIATDSSSSNIIEINICPITGRGVGLQGGGVLIPIP
ncbi:hypothetical protein VN97_g322 [Penicillium thymicola]|uniref:Uncharacterized protein n=1 Tax=Penicillium thymicola TaxID=293382 RepID=A0AAI9TSX3_PENTH|nr:hypothetical protein VN97_g322 [Penicillium thymicola]